LLLTGPSVTRPFARKLIGEKEFRGSLKSAGFAEIDFFGLNYTGGEEAFALRPGIIPPRESAFDSVVAAHNKADVAKLRQIVEEAKPSLLPGDSEFLSAYIGLLEKGYFGEVDGCRWEGLQRFHGDDNSLMESMRQSGLVAKPGTCSETARRSLGDYFSRLVHE
jgi:hypothetical protein